MTIVLFRRAGVGTCSSITDTQRRGMRNGSVPMHGPLLVDLAGLPGGVYLFQAAHRNKALAPATRFTLVW